MCQQVPLEIRQLSDPRLDSALNRLRETHANGGALFASLKIGPSAAFDWFASGNRLLEFGIPRQLLDRAEVTHALPALQIQPSNPDDPAFAVRRLADEVTPEQLADLLDGELPGNVLGPLGVDGEHELGDTAFDGTFRVSNSFLLDGELAQELHAGGAYTTSPLWRA